MTSISALNASSTIIACTFTLVIESITSHTGVGSLGAAGSSVYASGALVVSRGCNCSATRVRRKSPRFQGWLRGPRATALVVGTQTRREPKYAHAGGSSAISDGACMHIPTTHARVAMLYCPYAIVDDLACRMYNTGHVGIYPARLAYADHRSRSCPARRRGHSCLQGRQTRQDARKVRL